MQKTIFLPLSLSAAALSSCSSNTVYIQTQKCLPLRHMTTPSTSHETSLEDREYWISYNAETEMFFDQGYSKQYPKISETLKEYRIVRELNYKACEKIWKQNSK